ncbi:hypothetical protein SK128_008490 [Halocaridina rubra]|uniref:Uncharacterized protein n=1 Tax=Halocaridina rubra TaxID=373956 RepID=A0AAN8WXL3_HALRR
MAQSVASPTLRRSPRRDTRRRGSRRNKSPSTSLPRDSGHNSDIRPAWGHNHSDRPYRKQSEKDPYSARSMLTCFPHIHPPIIQGSPYSIHPPKPRPPSSISPINSRIHHLSQQYFIIHPLHRDHHLLMFLSMPQDLSLQRPKVHPSQPSQNVRKYIPSKWN